MVLNVVHWMTRNRRWQVFKRETRDHSNRVLLLSLNLAGRHWRSPPTSQRPDSCIWNSVSCQFDVCYSSRFLLFDRDFCTPVLPCVVMPAFFGSAVCPHKDLEWSSKIDTSTWSLKLSANVCILTIGVDAVLHTGVISVLSAWSHDSCISIRGPEDYCVSVSHTNILST